MAIYFIKPSEVIERIRQTITLAEANLSLPPEFDSYSQNVGGSAYISELTEANIQELPSPSCFVVLSDGTANTKVIENLDQDIFHGFDIVVVIDTEDRRKQTAEETIVTFKALLLYCLNGWKPLGYACASPLRYVGDSTVFSDKPKYVRVFTFVQDTRFIASQDALGDLPEDYDLQNFENFFADLFASEHEDPIQLQVLDMNDEP